MPKIPILLCTTRNDPEKWKCHQTGTFLALSQYWNVSHQLIIASCEIIVNLDWSGSNMGNININININIWQRWYTCGRLEVEFPNGIRGCSLHVDERSLNYFLGHLHKIQTVQNPCALDNLTVSRCLKATSTDEMHKALTIAIGEGEWKPTNPDINILDRN